VPTQPRIVSILFNNSTRTVSLTIRATLGTSYTVQRTVSLPGTWQTIGQIPAANDDIVGFTDPNRPAADTTSFYRVIRN
jgi:hypothetical protein